MTFSEASSMVVNELVLAVEISFTQSDGESSTLRATNSSNLFTEPTDDPANVYYSAALKSFSWKRSLSVLPGFGGSTEPVGGRLVFDASVLEDWSNSTFGAVTVKAGFTYLPGWKNYPFSSFETVFVGKVQDVVSAGDSEIAIEISGNKIDCNRPFLKEKYRAFGRCAKLNDTAKLVTPTNAAYTLASLTAIWFGVVTEFPSSGTACLFRHNADYGIGIDSAGLLYVIHDSGQTTATSYKVTLGDHVTAALTVATSGSTATFNLWAGSTVSNFAKHLDQSLATTIADGALHLGRFSGAGMDADVWSFRLYSKVLTESELAAAIIGPVVDPSTESDLVDSWRFEEGSGDVVASELSTGDLSYTQTPLSWGLSLEGDDPLYRGGALLGVSKPDGRGKVFNIPLKAVGDSTYQWSASSSSDLELVRVDGAPMVPDERLTVQSSGDISFDNPSSSFNLGGGLTGHRFVVGQEIVVENDLTYAGSYLVTESSVSSLTVTDLVGTPVSLASGNLTVGAILRTPDNRIQYTYDLSRSTITFNSSPSGTPTADAILGSGDFAVSEHFADLVGSASNQLEFDPNSGYYVDSSQVLISNVVDRLMLGVAGWWSEDRDGTFRIGNYGKPSGTPGIAFVGSNEWEIDTGSAQRHRVLSIEKSKTVEPAREIEVQFLRNYAKLSSTVDSLDAGVRQKLESDWSTESRLFPSVEDEYPGSKDLAVETDLNERSDAKSLMERMIPLHTEKPVFFDVEIESPESLLFDLYALVWIQHPDGSLGIQQPTLGRIVSIDYDSQRGSSLIVVHT